MYTYLPIWCAGNNSWAHRGCCIRSYHRHSGSWTCLAGWRARRACLTHSFVRTCVREGVPVGDAVRRSVRGAQPHRIVGNDLGESRVHRNSTENVTAVELFAESHLVQPINQIRVFRHAVLLFDYKTVYAKDKVLKFHFNIFLEDNLAIVYLRCNWVKLTIYFIA